MALLVLVFMRYHHEGIHRCFVRDATVVTWSLTCSCFCLRYFLCARIDFVSFFDLIIIVSMVVGVE